VWGAKCIVQAIDKAAKGVVDKAVEEAKTSPEPRVEDLWSDIYYKGTEPPFMRGREREEVREAIILSTACLSVLCRFTFSKPADKMRTAGRLDSNRQFNT